MGEPVPVVLACLELRSDGFVEWASLMEGIKA